MKKISILFGTRPEAIKLCPLILAMKKHHYFSPHICVSAQHREMLDQALQVFEVSPHVDLDLMKANQTLAKLTSLTVEKIDNYLALYQPDMVMVQGDTTTSFCAALAAFYRQIPIAHVEAGLRTGKKFSPFPEEINRVFISRIADLHFAPTQKSYNNLRREGVNDKNIYVTGNTVIDALNIIIDKIRNKPPLIPGLPEYLQGGKNDKEIVLITSHRRENQNKAIINICEAISILAKQFKNTEFVYPVHLNPNVREPVFRLIRGRKNVHLINPLSYLPFIALMKRAKLILTDSGGIQEEAPSLGKPVLVVRNVTERPDAVEAGTAKIVGTNKDDIINYVSLLLTNDDAYGAMAHAINPFGDGKACERILSACVNYWNDQEKCK